MYDMLPFPQITATDTKDQIKQINDYLMHFKESLEFILMNISADNLSSSLLDKLNKFEKEIEALNTVEENVIQQVSNKTITALDVIGSEAYKASIKQIEDKFAEELKKLEKKITPAVVMDTVIDGLKVNLETGELEYKE